MNFAVRHVSYGSIRVILSALQPLPLFTQFQANRCAALSVAAGQKRTFAALVESLSRRLERAERKWSTDAL